jgi:hypothetical protein
VVLREQLPHLLAPAGRAVTSAVAS